MGRPEQSTWDQASDPADTVDDYAVSWAALVCTTSTDVPHGLEIAGHRRSRRPPCHIAPPWHPVGRVRNAAPCAA